MTVSSDTFQNYHTYEFDWSPDSVTWSIDGQSLRTLKKSDTWNSTSNRFEYPQTPARIQLSLWPGGLSTNAEGTIAWAGGVINWDAPDVTNAGYFYAMVSDVNVECYSAPAGASTPGSKAYVYTASSGLNNSVAITDDNTVLNNFLDSGLDPTAGASGTSSSAGAAATSAVPNVPGMSGACTGTSGQRGGSSCGDSSSESASASSGTSSANTATQSTFHGFSQGAITGAAAGVVLERLVYGLVMAALVTVAGLAFL